MNLIPDAADDEALVMISCQDYLQETVLKIHSLLKAAGYKTWIDDRGASKCISLLEILRNKVVKLICWFIAYL